MKRIYINTTLLIIFLMLPGISPLRAQFFFDVETGVVFTGYNDVRIPGNTGTLFSMSEELEASPKIDLRIRAGYILGTRHNLSLLYAPLTVKSEGSIPRDINFEGVIFPSNTQLKGSYKFNSYRITYRYDIVERPEFEFGLGFTAKIRDARIALTSADIESEKTNVGFVPIINFLVAWKPREDLSFLLEGDALAAPQGRAEDVFIGAKYDISDKIGLKAGYRLLEGGADNDEVYNFALFNYAAFGILIRL